MSVRVSYLYSGMPDYWGGDGDRWEDNKGCLFAFYGPTTTLADIVDDLCDDFNSGGDCDSLPDNITSGDIREGIMQVMLNDLGRGDVAHGVIAECAADYADANGFDECRECGACVGEGHEEGCSLSVDLEGNEGETSAVVEDDCAEDDDMCDSPMFVALVEVDVCPECGAYVEDEDEWDDGLCTECAEKDGQA